MLLTVHDIQSSLLIYMLLEDSEHRLLNRKEVLGKKTRAVLQHHVYLEIAPLPAPQKARSKS